VVHALLVEIQEVFVAAEKVVQLADFLAVRRDKLFDPFLRYFETLSSFFLCPVGIRHALSLLVVYVVVIASFYVSLG